MSEPDIPTHIRDALRGSAGNLEAARRWVMSEVREVTLSAVMWNAAAYEEKLSFVRLALARGADPNAVTTVHFHDGSETQIQQITLLCLVSARAWLPSSPHFIDLLIKWGAKVQYNQANMFNKLEDDRTEVYRCSPLAYAILYPLNLRTDLLAVATTLLRAGASLDSVVEIGEVDAQGNAVISRSHHIEWVLDEKQRREPSLANDPNYLALKALLRQVRAAGGYRGYVIEQRRTLALVRHLAIRDRATTRDGLLDFLARTGEAGLFRRVLSCLSPPPPSDHTALNIRVVWVKDGEPTNFKINPTTKLMKVFKAYATRKGYPVARFAFSLPASEVLIEGCQSAGDIGLEDGAVGATGLELDLRKGCSINAMFYAEHPAGLRQQAIAAAAAAAAAAPQQHLEHPRRQRFPPRRGRGGSRCARSGRGVIFQV